MGAAESKDATQSNDYIIATDAKATVFVRRSDVTQYQDLVAVLLNHFPTINATSIVVQTNEMDVCAGRDVEIPSHLWPEISPKIRNITVVSRPTQNSTIASRLMTINVQNITGELFSVSLPRSASVADLVYAIQDAEGIPSHVQDLTYEGQCLEWNLRLSEYDIPDWATIDLQIDSGLPLGLLSTGKKPVLYLFCPLPIHAIVRLSLIKAWSFSAVYPEVPIKESEFGQSITWNVNTHDDHTLTDTTTGARVSYLFWEMATNPGLPPSPPASPVMLPNDLRPFNPLRPEVTNDNSVVLHTPKVAAYLDKALTALGLHIEARTSFITFWIPFILKHDYIALNFLPQASYEHAAPLDVEPKPDVVIRVFMLFKKVSEDELENWERALSRASEGVEFWKSLVGIDCDGMKDEKLFRVLEWGGMEVKR